MRPLGFYKPLIPPLIGTIVQVKGRAAQAASGTNTPPPAYPAIVGIQGTQVSSSTNHVINLPGGIQSGDLCLIIGCSGFTTTTMTWPGGWGELADLTGAPPMQVGFRWCTGGESSVTVVATTAGNGCWLAYRINNALWGQNPEFAAVAQTSTTTPNPPALSPSWGYALTLWFAANTNASLIAPTGYPSGYGYSQNFQAGLGGNSVAVCSRQFASASDDPGNINYAAAVARRPATLAVRPNP